MASGTREEAASSPIAVQTNSPPEMDARLLALVCSGTSSSQDLESFLHGQQDRQAAPSVGGSAVRRLSGDGDDEEAFLTEPLLGGLTVGGDTILHVVATNGDSQDFLKKADLIHRKAQRLLYAQNNNGDTPLHCAAREGNFAMASLLIDLARGEDANASSNRVKALLRTENMIKWTALHEAIKSVHVRHHDIVKLLMKQDSQLASFPKDGTSPLYLAILEGKKSVVETIYELRGGALSYSGPNGQNVLHAAVLRGQDPTQMLKWNSVLALQRDNNGRTPLHFAATTVLGRHDILSQVLKANPEALYQPDRNGSFPIHVAASAGATRAISEFIESRPDCAGLRDVMKRTFLHVAVDRKKISTVGYASKNQSLSWIFNMQDNNGNTALHLAVQAGSVQIFCCLFGNRQVQLDLTNKKGETPLDIAYQNIPKGLHADMHSEARILSLLKYAGATRGIRHLDYFDKNDIVQKNQGEIDEMKKVKDATQSLCIGSVLIATVTFGAAFAMPGGYRADDHTNGGTPTLAGRYGFDAFTLANALAFACSTMATISLMSSGSPIRHPRSRTEHLRMAYYLMSFSVTSLVAAFALAAYTILAPVTHKTAIGLCIMSSLILLYQNWELASNNIGMVAPLCRRKGVVWTFGVVVFFIVANVLIQLWPIIVIFSLAAINYHSRKVDPLVQPPTPLT